MVIITMLKLLTQGEDMKLHGIYVAGYWVIMVVWDALIYAALLVERVRLRCCQSLIDIAQNE